VLASLVVLFFMRSWRATFIAGMAIPVSVISTFGMMWALDFTLNSVTMLALVLMVGIVIDDAIVVLENIFRFVEEKQMTAFEAAQGGHGRDRVGGDGDHLQPGGDLCAGVLHVERGGPVSVPVWSDLGGGGAGESARVVHADADDERAAVRHGQVQAGGPPRRRVIRGRILRGHRTALLRSLGWSMRHRLLVLGTAVAVALSSVPLYGW
jgi:HAE1 family hydrophobic/amphiphilic exporter-1